MPLRIAMSGSTGLIGSQIAAYFIGRGHSLTPIIRSNTPLKANQKVIRWDIEFGKIDVDSLEGHDIVIHLSGASIADGRWTKEYKNLIEKSRVRGTSLLANTLAQLRRPPRVFLSASAVGYYGYDDPGPCDEGAPKGKGFLSDVCELWEKATEPAEIQGIRVVNLRFGVVLSKKGGALSKMLPIFRLGLGGKIASGRQMLSWIACEEIPEIISHLIDEENIRGPVNCVSPNAVSNLELTKTLGEVLNRPTVLPVPAAALKVILGEMADSLLIHGARVVPRKLLLSGYPFRFDDLKKTLRHILS